MGHNRKDYDRKHRFKRRNPVAKELPNYKPVRIRGKKREIEDKELTSELREYLENESF